MSYYHWVMETSLLKTLACKHKTTVTRIADKLEATKDTPHDPMKILRVTIHRDNGRELVAEFGGIPLRKQEVKERRNEPYIVWTKRSDPVKRLLKQECEMCGRKADELEALGEETYADLGLGVVDASIVALVERLGETKVATLDRRHFSVVRPAHVAALLLLPAPT